MNVEGERNKAVLAHRLRRDFDALYGAREAPRVFFAPGRVNLMGAHLDYNGGPVMPMAIDRGTFLAARPRSDRRVLLASTSEEARVTIDLDDLPSAAAGMWADYPHGVLRALLARAGAATGLELLFGGDLPVGAGLSSSASICIVTGLAVDALWNLGATRSDLVEAALEAERGFVGVQCGIMDPHAIGFAKPGQLLWLDCRDGRTEHLPLGDPDVHVAVADTGVRRELAHVAFNERVAETRKAFAVLSPHVQGARCLRDVPADVLAAHRGELEPHVARRAEHVLSEVRRTFEARNALLAGNVAAFGACMTLSHASLRDLYEVSVPELDRLVESATDVDGVLGSRLTGAGFGGCVVILVRARAREELERRLCDDYFAAFSRRARVEFFAGDAGPRELLALGSPA